MRRQSRELALQILFQIEFAPQIPSHEFLEVFEQTLEKDVVQYGEAIVDGVNEHRAAIDSMIQTFSKNWKVDRMSAVDRNILRIAVFEMKWASAIVKPSIVINEAVELAKKYGNTDSGSFVNGLLDQLSRDL
jgi:N utilization substance protein B